MKAVHIRIEGRVQGVGYRNAMRDAADSLGLKGWVRNRADGTVESQAVGEIGQIDALIEWCRKGSVMSQVTNVIVADMTEMPHYSAFTSI